MYMNVKDLLPSKRNFVPPDLLWHLTKLGSVVDLLSTTSLGNIIELPTAFFHSRERSAKQTTLYYLKLFKIYRAKSTFR